MAEIKKVKKDIPKKRDESEEADKKTIIIIIIALLLVLVLIIGGVFIFNSKDDGKTSKDVVKKKKLVKGDTIKTEELESVTGALAVIDEISPSIGISGEHYQTRVIDASISVKDNEQLVAVEYGFSNSTSVEPTYNKVSTNVKKYSKDIIYDTGTDYYKVSYLWVKATDKEGNVSVEKKEFITAQYINVVPNNNANVSGDLIITKAGTNINGMSINGSIYITSGVGLGDVTITNTTVKNNIYVNGGGTNSIYLNDVKVAGKIIVNNNNHVRLDFGGVINKTNIDLLTNTTITANDTNKNLTFNVIGDITVLIEGKVGKLKVTGNANVKASDRAQNDAVIGFADVDKNSSAKVIGYVEATNYDIKTNKKAIVSPVASLSVVSNGDYVSTKFTINRKIIVKKGETVTKEVYLNNVKALINAINANDEAALKEALAKFTENDIIVYIKYTDKEVIRTAQYADITGGTEENRDPHIKEYGDDTSDGTQASTEYSVADYSDQTNIEESRVIVLEKDPDSDLINCYYTESKDVVKVEPQESSNPYER